MKKFLFFFLVCVVLVNQAYAMNLLEAVKKGKIDRVEFLLCDPATNVNQRDDHGWTPLHWATYNFRAKLVRQLLDHGAHVNQGSSLDYSSLSIPRGSTPLYIAVYRGAETIINMLLEHGADVNRQTNKIDGTRGTTPRDWVMTYCPCDRVRRLFQNWPHPMLRKNDAQFVICSSLHPRLGASSPLQLLGKDVLENIARWLKPEHFVLAKAKCVPYKVPISLFYSKDQQPTASMRYDIQTNPFSMIMQHPGSVHFNIPADQFSNADQHLAPIATRSFIPESAEDFAHETTEIIYTSHSIIRFLNPEPTTYEQVVNVIRNMVKNRRTQIGVAAFAIAGFAAWRIFKR